MDGTVQFFRSFELSSWTRTGEGLS